TLDDLQNQGFDSVLVAIGGYDTNKLGVPGEDADEVLDGLEYLRTATLGLPYPGHAGKRVVVIGGGFTSMDCSRTSIRQGAAEVTLVYRRDMKDMPAANEVHQAIAEGRRAAYAVDAYMKGLDLSAIRTRQQLAEPQPEFLSIVPFTSEQKEPRYRLKALPAHVRNDSYIEYEIPYSREEVVAESTRC